MRGAGCGAPAGRAVAACWRLNVPRKPFAFAGVSDPLIARLKTLIVTTLKLEGVRPEDVPEDEPLIGSPRFGLDSIDALELVLALDKEFGIKIGSSEESREALGSVKALAAFIRSKKPDL